MSTVKVGGIKFPVSGGFYMRLFPYRVIKWGLQRINREGLPGIVYLHPWDLDPEHPLINPTPRERFTHYYNLNTTEEKLIRLLQEFTFAPLIDLVKPLQQQKGEQRWSI
jgi:hypothetical protein